MKKQLFCLAFASLFTSMAFATDRIVREGGAGGAFSSINAAIAAATDGDRIIIRPRVGNLPYIEDVTIDKSLSFVTEIQGDHYEISGNITIASMENRVVTIHDLNLVNNKNIQLSGTMSGGRMTVNVMNSIVSQDMLLGSAGVTFNAYNTQSRYITAVHGKFIANQCKRMTITGDAHPLSATEDVYVIANKITFPASGTSVPAVFQFSSDKYQVHILNNYIQNSLGAPAIQISGLKPLTNNVITNNFLYANQTGDASVVSISTTANANVNVNNNLFDRGNIQWLVNTSAQPYVTVQYNIVDSSSSTSFTTANVDFEASNTNITYGLTVDGVFSGNSVSNLGHPDQIYTDLDLTQNNPGPFGGSYSWENYWTGPNQVNAPHVYFLDTPRRVFNGTTTIDATGAATSK